MAFGRLELLGGGGCAASAVDAWIATPDGPATMTPQAMRGPAPPSGWVRSSSVWA
jgi:hypothetical protein